MAMAVVRAGLVAVGLAWVLAAQVVLAADLGSFVKEGSKAASLQACVEPTDTMRRKHMEFIKHQRDATVHGGIRGTKYSLAGCIECHVSARPDGYLVAVNGPGQFCNACHAFAAVNVNCFDCHASVPNGGHVSEAAVAAHEGAGLTAAGDAAVAKGQ
jgi:[DsrC]-trisulfide reductase subunit J